MKPADVKSSNNIDFNKENNQKDTKFEVGDHVRASEYKNHFWKRLQSKFSEKGFVIKKVKKNVSWKYAINGLNCKEIVGMFYEKES